jgi:hypothetical protein
MSEEKMQNCFRIFHGKEWRGVGKASLLENRTLNRYVRHTRDGQNGFTLVNETLIGWMFSHNC